MASVKKREKKWYATFKNERGLWQTRVTNAHDKASAKTIARQWETDAAMRRSGVIDPVLEAVGSESRRPIESHLDDFVAKMKGAKRSDKHIQDTLRYIREMRDESDWSTVGDIDADGVSRHAAKLQDIGRSSRTIQAYLTAITSFTRWLERGNKIHRDPLKDITKPNPDADRKTERRMILPEEWPWLERGTNEVGDQYGMTGAERRALYDMAIQTGLRSNEIRSLRRSSLVFDDEYPYVSVPGRTTKNKTPARQYIGRTLADELRTMVACKTANAALFNLPPKYDMAKMLRDDLASGRKAWLDEAKRDPEERIKREGSDFLEATNEAGETADFHALRHTCGSWLVLSGVPLNVVQQVMRHGSITLTIDTYGHMAPGATANAVAMLGHLISPPELLAATGTDACTTFVQNGTRRDGSSERDSATKSRVTPDDGSPQNPSKERDNAAPCAASAKESESAPSRTRTLNLLIKSQLLCQLS